MLPPLVEATTATLRAETAAVQGGKGLAATVQQKESGGSALRRSAQVKWRSRPGLGQTRPVKAPCAPLPPRGIEPETSRTRLRYSLPRATQPQA